MSFFHTLRRWIGLNSDEPDESDLRQLVEDALIGDDTNALVTVLRNRREDGKILIREYEAELEGAIPENRDPLRQRITALVAVYAKAFGDTEPLSWFQRAAGSAPAPEAAQALERAQKSFQSGDPAGAERIAHDGLATLPALGAERDRLSAVESSLHAIRGGAAAHQGRLSDARAQFDLALAPAEQSGSRDTLAATYLNLLDIHTRLDDFEDTPEEWERSLKASRDSRYEDVAGKLLIERGVALTRRGALESGVAILDAAIAFRPAWPFPIYQRAWARFLLGDSGGALEDYREVASRTPVFFTVQREIRCLEDVAAGNLPIDAYRSFCLVRDRIQKDSAAVEQTARRIVDRHPDFAAAWVLLSESLLAQGSREEGRSAAEEALARDPDPDTAAAALFIEWNVARGLKEFDAVAKAADRLSRAYPDHPAAEIVRRLGNTPDHLAAVRWTWAMDGTLTVEDVNPTDRTPPPPAPPG